MSQSIEMAVSIDITVLQSIEIAYRTDVTVPQLREIALGATLLCHSLWRWLLG